MKKVLISIAILAASVSLQANNFNMPGWGNNSNNGSGWNMPNMNWGNSNNGYNTNGNNWGGNNWSMPNMNWGNGNNGYNNGSNWNMPNMNWGNSNNRNGFNNGSSWSMPNMNWGNGNNNQPWNFGNGYNNNMPNAQYRGVPAMPVAPQFMPRANMQNKAQVAPVTKKPVVKATAPAVKATPAAKGTVQNKIPMPSEVKGTILAPANKVKVEAAK